MSNELQPSPPEGHLSPFERIRRTNPAGMEFWSSRDFAQVLGYTDYRNFEQVVQKARTACFNSAQRIEDHFVEITEMIEIGKGGKRWQCSARQAGPTLARFLILKTPGPKRMMVGVRKSRVGLPNRRTDFLIRPRAVDGLGNPSYGAEG